MKTGDLVTAIVLFVIAGALIVIAVLHFMEKGPLLNNANFYATKEQRKTMNKKPYYRQSAVVFLLLSAVFIVVGLSVVLQNGKLLIAEIPLFAGAVIYAIISAVRIGNAEKNTPSAYAYDPDKEKPIIRASICTGERVAGFKDKTTGSFREVMLIRNEKDLVKFKKTCKIDQIDTEY